MSNHEPDSRLLRQIIQDTARIAVRDELDKQTVAEGGGGGHIGGMTPWQQTVETRLSGLRSDFRWTWGLVLGGFVAMLATMAKGFGWF